LVVHPVQVGCAYDGMPMTAKIRPALIISHHDNDIQLVRRRRCKAMPDTQDGQKYENPD
jgi:hypothetical protein